jgi:hypothetical protein
MDFAGLFCSDRAEDASAELDVFSAFALSLTTWRFVLSDIALASFESWALAIAFGVAFASVSLAFLPSALAVDPTALGVVFLATTVSPKSFAAKARLRLL